MSIDYINILTSFKELGSKIHDNNGVIGMVSLMDDVYTVLDLKYLLTKKYTDIAKEAKNFILLNNTRKALLVGRFNEIIEVSEDEINELELGNSKHKVINREDKIFYIIDNNILNKEV